MTTSSVKPSELRTTSFAAPSGPGSIQSRPAMHSTVAKNLFLLTFLGLICIWFGLQSSQFATTSNALNILVTASVLGIVSLGQLLTIVSGGFDLSVGGTVPLGSVLFAIMLNQGRGVVLSLLVILAAGALVGAFNGLVVAQFNINPLATTLATTSIAGGLALALADGVTVPFEEPHDVLTRQSLLGVDNSVWTLFLISAVLLLVLRYTTYGRALFAVGGNRDAALLAGIPVKAVTASVYVISGVLAALAGAILASQVMSGSGTAGAESALMSVTAVIVGGASLRGGEGGVPGTLLGVLIIGALANGMQVLSIQAFYQTIATGVVLVVAVGFSQLRVEDLKARLKRKGTR